MSAPGPVPIVPGPPPTTDPSGPTASDPSRPRRRAGRLALQALGFAVGVALLAWCANEAFAGPRREELRRLLAAPLWQPGALIGLAVVSAAINGAAFWGVLRPLRRLRLSDVVAVNFVASFLAFLPFKLGAVFRIGVHHRRDGVPMRDIVAWLGAFAALSLAALGPMLLALFWRREIDLWWGVSTVLGVAGAIGVGMLLARLARSRAWLRHASLGSYRIVDRPGPGVWCAGCKLLDTGVHAARFLLAAYIFGIGLPPDRAMFYAAVYFLLGSASPAGMLGVRETGVVLLGLGESSQQLAQLVITLSATEALAYAITCLPALGWLARKRHASPEAAPKGPDTPPAVGASARP